MSARRILTVAVVLLLGGTTAAPAHAATKNIFTGDECTHGLDTTSIGTATFHRHGKAVKIHATGTISANSTYQMLLYKKRGSADCDFVDTSASLMSDGTGAFDDDVTFTVPRRVTVIFVDVYDQTHNIDHETHFIHLDP